MSGNSPSLELPRLAAVVHCVIAHTDPGRLGYVRLNRILWYSDLEHYRWHGVSITGLQHYARTPQGPMSNDVSRAVARLVSEGKVLERTVKIADYTRREMACLQRPDASAISAEQAGILNQMIKFVAALTARQLSQITHDDPLWRELNNNEAMSIATGSVVTQLPTSK